MFDAPFFKIPYTMKRIFYMLVVALAVCLVGCSEKKKTYSEAKNNNVLPTLMDVTGKDTTDVIEKTKEFSGCLERNDVRGALDMLHSLAGDSIVSLPDELASRQWVALNNISGYTYRIERIVFFKETDCEVKLVAEMFKKEDGDPRPNEIGIILKPVRFRGEWYLTLADSPSDTTGGSAIKN